MFTFSRTPTNANSEALAQYVRKELERILEYLEKSKDETFTTNDELIRRIAALENRITKLESLVD